MNVPLLGEKQPQVVIPPVPLEHLWAGVAQAAARHTTDVKAIVECADGVVGNFNMRFRAPQPNLMGMPK